MLSLFRDSPIYLKLTGSILCRIKSTLQFRSYRRSESKGGPMNSTISQAIRERRFLIFTYDCYSRVVEPYCHGITTAGNEALRCYQITGGSSSGTVPGWHMMTTDKILGLTISPATFPGARSDYRRDDRDMATIFEQL